MKCSSASYADHAVMPTDCNDRLLLGLKGTMSEALWRIRHKASYADHAVMPTMRRKVFAALVFGAMMSA
jgi:hypothetical protein